MASVITGISLVILIFLFGTALYGIRTVARFKTRRPLIATPLAAQRRIIEIADLKPDQTVYDLGSGSGSLLRRLDRKYRDTPLRLIGIEDDPVPWAVSRFLNRLMGSRAIIRREDYFQADLRDADFIYCWLSRGTMKRLGEKFRGECRRGTRVASYGFPMEGFSPKRTLENVAGNNLYIYET